MSSDLIGVLVAAALAAAVFVLGWRRRLDRSTDEWLPEFGRERVAEDPRPPYRFEQSRQAPSPAQRRWMIGFYLVLAVAFAGAAIFPTHDRLGSAYLAGINLIGALLYWRRWRGNADDAKSQAQ